MTPEQQAELRKPFPPAEIHQLPKPFKRDATKGNCQECGKYHGLPAAHLDYVGHAEVTNRLLQVDPEWTWEPVAWEGGYPAMERTKDGQPVGMWIRLTIAGVTRLGFGSVSLGVFDAEKQLIGDALRNAAMRFGVGLDLWSKSDLHTDDLGDTGSAEQERGTERRQFSHNRPPMMPKPAEGPTGTSLRDKLNVPLEWKTELINAIAERKMTNAMVAAALNITPATTNEFYALAYEAISPFGIAATLDEIEVKQ